MPLVQPMVGAHSVVRGVTEFPTEANRVGLESKTIRYMSETSISAAASHRKEPSPIADDILTICAISIVAGILTNILHEGVGHGLVALLTGAKSGVLTTVAWSSAFDSRLVAAGGTLVNLAAALVFWLALVAPSAHPCPFATSCSSRVHSICLPEPGTFSSQA